MPPRREVGTKFVIWGLGLCLMGAEAMLFKLRSAKEAGCHGRPGATLVEEAPAPSADRG